MRREVLNLLKNSNNQDNNVIFHQLDVVDSASVKSPADFIKCQFGKLDILVNNAAISGYKLDCDVVKDGVPTNWPNIVTQTYESVEKCIETNYYGAKRMCEALIPFLQLSDAPRIVNVSSYAGKLKHVTFQWAKEMLRDAENLTEERVDEVLNQYKKKFQEGLLETEGWPDSMSGYVISKAGMNAYTRIVANKYPNIVINCVCPGHVRTDMSYNTGPFTVEEGAKTPVWLALLPNGSSSGLFYVQKEETSFE